MGRGHYTNFYFTVGLISQTYLYENCLIARVKMNFLTKPSHDGHPALPPGDSSWPGHLQFIFQIKNSLELYTYNNAIIFESNKV